MAQFNNDEFNDDDCTKVFQSSQIDGKLIYIHRKIKLLPQGRQGYFLNHKQLLLIIFSDFAATFIVVFKLNKLQII